MNSLDTADIYGCGANERLVGKAVGNRRQEVLLATKFGNVPDEAGRFLEVNGRPEYVCQACDASLLRLGTDVIDLSQSESRKIWTRAIGGGTHRGFRGRTWRGTWSWRKESRRSLPKAD